MLKKLAKGGAKMGCKAIVGMYVRLIMTVVYAVATLIGGAKAVGVIRKNKKIAHWSILGITAGSIGVSIALWVKDLYETCQMTGTTWLWNSLYENVFMLGLVLWSMAYLIINLVKAYINRLEASNNELLIAMIEAFGIVVLFLVLMFTHSMEKYYWLMPLYPVGKFLVTKRLASVISAVKESKDEEVDFDLTNVKLSLPKLNRAEEIKSDEPIKAVASNDLSWEEIGLGKTSIEEQLCKENEVAVKVTEQPTVKKAEPKAKLDLGIIRNFGSKKAPDRKVKTEQLNDSISNLLDDAK